MHQFKKWQCTTCGDIYDEAHGSPDDGIPPGTRFEDLPSDWLCLSCGSGKDAFVIIEE